jgi:hypothetical protein
MTLNVNEQKLLWKILSKLSESHSEIDLWDLISESTDVELLKNNIQSLASKNIICVDEERCLDSQIIWLHKEYCNMLT